MSNADALAEQYDDVEMLQIDGFDDCIVGLVNRFGADPILCYDEDKMIEKIMAEHECDWHEASEHFEFNIAGAWMGDATPCFLTPAPVFQIDIEDTH